MDEARSTPQRREALAQELARVAGQGEESLKIFASRAMIELFLDGTFGFDLLPNLQAVDEALVRKAVEEGELGVEIRQEVDLYWQRQSQELLLTVHRIDEWLQHQMDFDRMYNPEEPCLDRVP